MRIYYDAKEKKFFAEARCAAPSLSLRQAALGKRLVNKYRRQLDPGLVAIAGIKLKSKLKSKKNSVDSTGQPTL